MEGGWKATFSQDIANSATQFLVDIQLMPFAPRLDDFLPPPDPN